MREIQDQPNEQHEREDIVHITLPPRYYVLPEPTHEHVDDLLDYWIGKKDVMPKPAAPDKPKVVRPKPRVQWE